MNVPKTDRKTIILSVRLTQEEFNWIREKKISISKVCEIALKELGFKKPNKK